jgi:hypothetical protein
MYSLSNMAQRTGQIAASKNNRSLTIGAAINGGRPQAKGVVTIKRFNDTDLN